MSLYHLPYSIPAPSGLVLAPLHGVSATLPKKVQALQALPSVSYYPYRPFDPRQSLMTELRFGAGGDGCPLCLLVVDGPKIDRAIEQLQKGEPADYNPSKAVKPLSNAHHRRGTRMAPPREADRNRLELMAQGFVRDGGVLQLQQTGGPLAKALVAGMANLSPDKAAVYDIAEHIPVKIDELLPERFSVRGPIHQNPLENLSWATVVLEHHNNHGEADENSPNGRRVTGKTKAAPIAMVATTVLPERPAELLVAGMAGFTGLIDSPLGTEAATTMLMLYLAAQAQHAKCHHDELDAEDKNLQKWGYPVPQYHGGDPRFESVTFLVDAEQRSAIETALNTVAQRLEGLTVTPLTMAEQDKQSDLYQVAQALYPHESPKQLVAYRVQLPQSVRVKTAAQVSHTAAGQFSQAGVDNRLEAGTKINLRQTKDKPAEQDDLLAIFSAADNY